MPTLIAFGLPRLTLVWDFQAAPIPPGQAGPGIREQIFNAFATLHTPGSNKKVWAVATTVVLFGTAGKIPQFRPYIVE
jgi:hypothetical protein